jgi:hypothetical protein
MFFEQLDDHRRAVYEADAIADVVGLAREDGRRHADVMAAKQLQAPQLVPRPGDRL